MSLFATDAALLNPQHARTAPARPDTAPKPAALSQVASPLTPRPSPLSTLLPSLVTSAVRRGHVRSAALMLETAMHRLDAADPALEAARRTVDGCASADAALQRRQIAGEAIIVSSCTDTPTGEPRFRLGFEQGELAHDAIIAFAEQETTDGAQAETRNFLDETLRADDTLLDLDPGAGAVAFTAATSQVTGLRVAVWSDDATLVRALRRNLVAHGPLPALAQPMSVNDGAPSSSALSAALSSATRLVVHLGDTPVAALAGVLAGWSARAVAIAWRAGNTDTGLQLERAGFESFALAMRGGELELVPTASVQGAEYAFALSSAFIASLG